MGGVFVPQSPGRQHCLLIYRLLQMVCSLLATHQFTAKATKT